MTTRWTRAAVLVSLTWSSIAMAGGPTLNGSTFVASTKPIKETSSTNTAAPENTFRFDQPLTVRVFFKDTLKTMFRLTDTKYRVNVEEQFLCGSRVERQRVRIWVPKGDFNKNFLDLEVIPDLARAHTKYQDENNPTLLGWSASEGKAKCAMEAKKLILMISPSNARADDIQLPPLDIDFSGVDLAKAKKMDEQAKAAGMAAFAKNLALPEAGMKDAKLEAQLVTLWKKNQRGSVKRARAIILSESWGVEVDDRKRAISRGLDVTMLSQKKDGKCFSESVAVNEAATGKGFGPPSFASQGQSERQVDCKKAFGGK
jgi:hypothetical protein